jgi:hypothetical protein
MRAVTIRKWIYYIGTSACLLQATAGCPDDTMVRGVVSNSVQSLITGILGLYIKTGVNSVLGV